MDAATKAKFLQALKSVPLLGRLTEKQLLQLGEAFDLLEFKPNQDIIKQGEKGDGFYIMQEGKAKVTIKSNGQTSEVGELKAGDYFGERALLNTAPRAATVTATAATRCLYWSAEAFYKLFTKSDLNIQFAKRVAVSAESMGYEKRGSAQNFSAPPNAVYAKTKDQEQLIKNVLESQVMFRGLKEEHTDKIIELMYKVTYRKGQIPITQGDRGDRLYVVETGLFEVRVKKDGKERAVAQRGAGTLFGELALMYNAPRAATVVALTDADTWVVDRFTFRRVLKNISDMQLEMYRNFLSKVSLLAPLTDMERAKIAEALEEIRVAAGTVIMKQGQKGSSMYILGSGKVSCEKDGQVVAEIHAGDYFGERALLKADSDQKRAATVIADTECRLLKLSRNAVFLLLGPVEDIMKQRVKGYDAMNKEMKVKAQTETRTKLAKPERKKRDVPRDMKDFKIIGTLGRGSFGHVQLVEDDAGHTYALKAVSKKQIIDSGQRSHIISEKRVMEALDHPFCIKLFGYYHDPKCIYLLLEVALGGELFSILRSRMFFNNSTSRFYAGCVVLAFEYMHERDIIYRDLKPENLLLDSRGFLKVTDFGFAKVVPDRTHTLCGTPDYLAPEIVQGSGHGKAVDWWTLGVLIYEMITSSPPFYDDDQMVTYQKIVSGAYSFPSHFRSDAKSIVKKLLHPKPHKRLGAVKGGARVIKVHDWFHGFDFDALVNMKMKPPIVPKIKHERDLTNFDDYGDEDSGPIPVYRGRENWDKDFLMK
eukprot:CAMPEP_0167753154 /NCGR_PEP_ID=MMETSP0110_2-20121227/7548_1 /TAXON_ID=629695 /ORGANISM="Gymnochlora sp., Strain CCMP2014" /LENGTH=761 /DNA_ID=CAMNT_0007638873 /DNA_START=3 /DNA_END=2288 /DNA_ORIENTATION=+